MLCQVFFAKIFLYERNGGLEGVYGREEYPLDSLRA
jgi:hypothetical protein